jgi:hypothetical protein
VSELRLILVLSMNILFLMLNLQSLLPTSIPPIQCNIQDIHSLLVNKFPSSSSSHFTALALNKPSFLPPPPSSSSSSDGFRNILGHVGVRTGTNTRSRARALSLALALARSRSRSCKSVRSWRPRAMRSKRQTLSTTATASRCWSRPGGCRPRSTTYASSLGSF